MTAHTVVGGLAAALGQLNASQRIAARHELRNVCLLMPPMRDEVRGLEMLCASVARSQVVPEARRRDETDRRNEVIQALLEQASYAVRNTRPKAPELHHGVLFLLSFIYEDLDLTLRLLREPKGRVARRKVYTAQRLLREVRSASVESQGLLARTADDFSGSDLRGVNLSEVDLSWVLWDESTMWPTGWAERIRRSSVQQGPGLWLIRPLNADVGSGHLMDV
ncbi:hypothetical protein NJO91_30005 [Streptomyces microflavus]|uniref:hypothetical protein n=1 Tax=Streptomyces microflavus TaxID=1919 RepID=UPI0029A354A2|nr:hypothetical protein [Streptomyces microflavus]MDX2407347.1 hypothetical protein [Streptomyces microflavus]